MGVRGEVVDDCRGIVLNVSRVGYATVVEVDADERVVGDEYEADASGRPIDRIRAGCLKRRSGLGIDR